MDDNTLEKLREWEHILGNISDFVLLKNINGIKFIVRTNESGNHHTPHLHVETSSASMSIAIADGKILASNGKISPVQFKTATKWMQDNKTIIETKWNEFSNGFTIPT